MKKNSDVTKGVKSTPIGGRTWLSLLLFGFVGQIAWMVENMYFATMAQDIFANSGRQDLSYIITTLMVIFSALTATLTTIFAGGLCDKARRRKPFIVFGYIVWGITIMVFSFIPMRVDQAAVAAVAALLVIFDCIMTLVGSTANDAAFNAWVADNTDTTNRGKVNTVLSILPVIAVVVIFIALGPLYSAANASNYLFFIVLGAIPLVSGIVGIFAIREADSLTYGENDYTVKGTLYGFRPDVIKANKMLYVCLATSCIVGISQQTFFSYLINFLKITLGLGDGFVVPMAVIIVGAAVITGVCGIFFDKLGRKHFYIPLLAAVTVGTLAMYVLKYMSGVSATVMLFVGGTVMMGAILALGGALGACFQDYIPHGYEGRFQGVRMCFTVLIPMIVGPIVSMIIGLDAMGMNGENFAPTYDIFLAAAIIAVIAFIPIFFVRRDASRLREELVAERDGTGKVYVVLDMEWNQPVVASRAKRHPFFLRGEIIQIGAVMLNSRMEIIDDFKMLVSPVYYKRMNSHVTKITGIRTADLKYGMPFEEAVEEFRDWCGGNFVILTWGCDDLPMLKDNIKLHRLSDEWIPEYYDLQVMYGAQIAHERRQFSLESAIKTVGEEFYCDAHDALNDAISTARVCKHIDIERGIEDYNKPIVTEKAIEEPIEIGTTYKSRSAAYRDEELCTHTCDKCGKEFKCGKWIGARSAKAVSLGDCECGEHYFFRLKFKRQEDSSWSVTRTVLPLTEERKTCYDNAVKYSAERSKYRHRKPKSKETVTQ